MKPTLFGDRLLLRTDVAAVTRLLLQSKAFADPQGYYQHGRTPTETLMIGTVVCANTPITPGDIVSVPSPPDEEKATVDDFSNPSPSFGEPEFSDEAPSSDPTPYRGDRYLKELDGLMDRWTKTFMPQPTPVLLPGMQFPGPVIEDGDRVVFDPFLAIVWPEGDDLVVVPFFALIGKLNGPGDIGEVTDGDA